MRGLAAVLATLASFGLPVAAQDPATKSFPSRVELHPIATETLSDEQFLKGESAGGTVTVAGQLRLAQAPGRQPVVVLVHGSSGMGPNIELWSRELNEMGIATFALDGFTGRGLVTVGQDQARLGRLNMVLDAYRVLGVLAKHPRVDPARIALMGFSRGGQTALFASLDRFHRQWNRSGIGFAAYIPFYPDCMTSYIADTEVAARPIRIFHGTPDDYNPVAPCRAYVERLAKAGRDVRLTEYPNAPHGFDNPLGAVPAAVSKSAQTVRRCRIREDATGVLVNAETGERFTYRDACVELGPSVGYDAAATAAARDAVKDFLRSLFAVK
jgi:dienelactone hydrolase